MTETAPRPGLFAYKTDARYDGAIALDWYDPDPNSEEMSAELWTGHWATGWSHVVPYVTADGDAALVRYAAGTGGFGLATVRRDGSGVDDVADFAAAAEHEGYDALCLDVDGPGLYAYRSGSGDVIRLAIHRDEGRIEAVESAKLDAGYDLLAPLHMGDGPALIALRHGAGEADLWHLSASPFAAGKAWSDTWAGSATGAVQLYGDTSQLFRYGAGDGAWERRTIDAAGSTSIARGTWPGGWDVFVPFTMSGAEHIVGYRTETGDVEILRLEGDGGEVVWTFRWSAGWDVMVPLTWGPDP